MQMSPYRKLSENTHTSNDDENATGVMGVVATLPSDWSDRVQLSSLYHELLLDDEWIAPTQAQLTQVQEQNMVQELTQVPRSEWQILGEYERWQPGEQWQTTYRQYTGSPGKVWSTKALSVLSTLEELGLDETSMVLDIGCGPLRLGRLLIPFLARGHYHCVEPNRELIQDGIKFELGYDLLQRKLPSFAINADFLAPPGLLESLVGSDAAATSESPTYTFMLARSIFTHTADDLFHLAMSNLKPRFASKTVMIATIHFTPCGDYHLPSNDTSISGWVYAESIDDPLFVCHEPEHFTKLLQVHGLVWEHYTSGEVFIYLHDHT